MNTNELCIPESALSEQSEDGQAVAPEVGDTVEVTIAGRVSRAEGGQVYIQPETANGQPIAEGKAGGMMGMGMDEETALRNDVSGYGLLAVLIFFLLSLQVGSAADLAWALARTCSGTKASNYVALTTRQQVFYAEADNLTGSTLYLLVFDSATNQLAGAVPHFTPVPIPTGSVGGKSFTACGAPFQYGVNVCLSTTPYSLTNASSGGVITVIHSPLNR